MKDKADVAYKVFAMFVDIVCPLCNEKVSRSRKLLGDHAKKNHNLEEVRKWLSDKRIVYEDAKK